MIVSGNKILVTGASKGIGKALVDEFLALGNDIIAVSRDKKLLEAQYGNHDNVSIHTCDLGDKNEIDRLILYIEKEHPDLNILVNNAGIQYNYDIQKERQLLDKIEHENRVNFLAPIRLITLLLPTIALNANAAVVNISSGLALVPKMQAPSYCATKAGIHIFSKALRYQLDHVKVFEIIPPLVDTEMTFGRGKGKISPEKLVKEFMKSFRKNNYEVSIGKVKLLKLINRISPRIADFIMKGG